MEKSVLLCPVTKARKLREDLYEIVFKSETAAKVTVPGQFFHVRVSDTVAPLLRRPISVADVDTNTGEIRLIYQVKGEGTRLLTRVKEGDILDLLGPLGNGFLNIHKYHNPLIVGGGIGAFPLLYLTKKLKSPTVCLGFKTKEQIVLTEDFEAYGGRVYVATDDGSFGFSGYAAALAEEQIQKNRPDVIFCCGPMVMMKSVASLAEKYQIPCQVSLEERMGCGIGACLVCACGIKKAGTLETLHVCKNGPVFWGSEVVFDA